MLIRRSLLGLAFIGCTPLLCSPVHAKAEWKNELIQKLEAIYPLSKLNFTMTTVKETGGVIVLQLDGVAGTPSENLGDTILVPPSNRYLGPGKLKVSDSGSLSRIFKSGDRFYVYKISLVGNGFMFYIISVDSFPFNTVQGAALQSHYEAVVIFDFDKIDQNADVGKLKAAFDNVFKVESEANAIHSKTVELGQTLEQVEATLGKPGKVISLGPKTIYVYSDIKVVFVDGKVSDVQ
jgi:hypothetical protein